MEFCCKNAATARYRAWLGEVDAQDHPWMLDNLRMCLVGTIGSDKILEYGDNLVRVAYVLHSDDRFTWARQLIVHCSCCPRVIGLTVLTSNAMFFLMRLILTAMLSVEAVRQDGNKTIFRLQAEPTENQRTQLDMAMDVYRARRDLTSDRLEQLLAEIQTVPKLARTMASKLYMTGVCWLLFHEIGHMINDEAGPAPLIGQMLDRYKIKLPPSRRSAWIDELSADLTASRILAGEIARHEASVLGPTSKEVGRDFGFGSGVIALTAFEIYEGYDIGLTSLNMKTDIGRDIAFATHPPLLIRKFFLREIVKLSGNAVNGIFQVAERALHDLFADYVDRHPMPK